METKHKTLVMTLIAVLFLIIIGITVVVFQDNFSENKIPDNIIQEPVDENDNKELIQKHEIEVNEKLLKLNYIYVFEPDINPLCMEEDNNDCELVKVIVKLQVNNYHIGGFEETVLYSNKSISETRKQLADNPILDLNNVKILNGVDQQYIVLNIKNDCSFNECVLNPIIINEMGEVIYHITDNNTADYFIKFKDESLNEDYNEFGISITDENIIYLSPVEEDDIVGYKYIISIDENEAIFEEKEITSKEAILINNEPAQ